MTYRLDSDIPHPYGRAIPINSNFSYTQKLNEIQWEHSYNETNFVSTLESRSKEFMALSKRFKAVAWVVSNCASESDRENYVTELRRHIQVSITKLKTDKHCNLNTTHSMRVRHSHEFNNYSRLTFLETVARGSVT